MPTDAVIEQKRKRVAADYRRQGYRVSWPNGDVPIPSFLHDCHPDLIAERDDDHVVIDIKRSNRLRGSNDMKELAARIAAQPGWRFELVTLGSDGDEAEVVSRPDWLEAMLRQHADAGPTIFRVLYLGQVLDFLVRGAAILNGMHVREKTVTGIAHELVFSGVMQQQTLDRIELVLDYRKRLMYGPVAQPPQTEEVTDITELCRRVYAECVTKATSFQGTE
jgi:hypothetical protein